MNKTKLIEKCEKRKGLTVFDTELMRKGVLHDFDILDNPDGTFEVVYIVRFTNTEEVWLEWVPERDLAIMIKQ